MNILIPGARGYLGKLVAPALEAAGHQVIRGSRRPYEPLRTAPDQRWETFDLDRETTWSAALRGVDLVLPLVRSDPSVLRRLAEVSGLPLVTVREQADLDGPGFTNLVAELVIGEGSEAWTVCRDIALRSPILLHPAWFDRPVRPIWQGDLVVAVQAAVEGRVRGQLAVPGPSAIPLGGLVEQVARARRMRHVRIPVDADLMGLGPQWLRLFSRVEEPVAKRVVRGLASPRPLPEHDVWEQLDHSVVPVDDAIRRALRYEHKPARLPERLLESVVRRAAGAGFKRRVPELERSKP